MTYDTTTDQAPVAKGLDEGEVLAEFKTRLAASKQHADEWRQEARTLYDLKAGHQWDPEDEMRLKEKYDGAYPNTTFNVANKYCSSVVGLQINNRQEMRYYPREEGDVGIDEFTTGTIKWCRDESEAEDEETDTFEDVFWVGMGWIEHFLNDIEDPEVPYIAQERRDPLEVYWDPMARKKNLVDRSYQIRIKPMSADEYEAFFGEEAENLEGANQLLADDQSPQRISSPHDYGNRPGSSKPNQIYVADYQFCRNKRVWRVSASFPEGPLTQLFQDAEWKKVKPALEAAGVPFEAEKMQTRQWYRAWVCGDQIKGKIRELPCGATYEAITGQRDRNTNTWFGMGRVVKDPQCWMNKFFASILYTMSVNAKGGLLAEEDAFEDQAKAERSWANPAAITFAANGAVSGNKIIPKPQSGYPQGLDRLMQFTLDLLPMTSGMNPELLGLANREQPGVLEAQRKQAAMSVIAWVFDAMRRYYKRSGKLMLSMVREYLNEGQLIRISGEKGQRYVRLFKDKLSSKYDLIVQESPTSVNQQERTWAILQQIIPMALQAQIPVPPTVLDYAPVPEDLKREWKQSLKPDPQKQQKQEMMMQAGAEAKIAKDQTAAELNAAKAQQIQAEANLAVEAAPIDNALKQMETIKTAAQSGAIQAGGM